MKKLLTLSLLLLLAALTACGGKNDAQNNAQSDTPSTTAATQPSEEEAPRIHYKELTAASATLEDMERAEGRAPDFTIEQDKQTLYIYNNVEMDGLYFTQVQYSFGETGCRVSCTYTNEGDLAGVSKEFEDAMTALYGEPAVSEIFPPIYTWRDGSTANYVTLMQLNDTTLHLAFYLREGA